MYNMFTHNRFDAELTAKKSKDRWAKLEELLKMLMSGDKYTETGSSKDSTSMSDSESDSQYRKSCKRRGAKHHKPLTKIKKSKCTSHKKASSDETFSKSSSSKSESEEEPQAKKRKDIRTEWKDTLKDRDDAIPEKEKIQEPWDTDKVEELIDRLAKMKVSDFDYVRIYYWALKWDAVIANIVAPPAKQNMRAENPLSCNNSRTERPPSRDSPQNTYCFSCGKSDHMMWQCSTINEWVEKGRIMKDEYGCLTHKDGTYIWRIGTETFEDTIKQTTMSSNLVTINMLRAETDSEKEDKTYMDYFWQEEEIDINEGYDDDSYVLGTCQIDKGNLHERRSAECMSFW